ncbi:MAG: DUF2806 domain-containing protein, partial [Dehalococcoidia bacterium]|nr:DUF2806 domain-containing protein [Dehalococcoidia bacterium]
KCRIVSDDQIQDIWSRILAGEANNPGSFSRKTVNLLADFDRETAQLFGTLCRFGWTIDGAFVPLVFDDAEDIYREYEMNTITLSHLEAIGLAKSNGILGFSISSTSGSYVAAYGGDTVHLTLAESKRNKLDIGQVLLTPSGLQLSSIVEREPVTGFFEFVYDKWVNEALISPRAG